MKTAAVLALLFGATYSLDPKNFKHAFKHGHRRSNGDEYTTTLLANEPDLCDADESKSYSGYFQADTNDNYFYWFFESRDSPSADPLVMWLTGGPGCSSMLALLAENGPCSVNDAATNTIVNPYSWTQKANVMWVDQPPGTGFSTGRPDTTEDEIAQDMFDFLTNFMANFPQYFTNGFYIFGESYAGHYVPAISYKVFEEVQSGASKIPFKGFAIGNGLTDPYIQYAYYAKMAYNSSTAPSVIPKTEYEFMTKHIPACQEMIQKCQTGSASDCENAESYCNIYEIEPVTATGINPYDLRIKCGSSSLCYNFTNVDVWLNNATVQKELGVDMKWEDCANAPHAALAADWMLEYQEKIPPMLAGGVRGLIYAGDQDFICNWLGNHAWATTLDWQYQSEFEAASDNPWSPDGTERGKLRMYKNFAFLQVYQAGHMVPMDQPVSAQLMLNEYLAGTIMDV